LVYLARTYSFRLAKARLQAELQESKAEIHRLKERMSLGVPTIHKEFSQLALILKRSGPEPVVTLEEFFDSTEGSARIGRWQIADKVEITFLKLTGPVEVFYQGCHELYEDDLTWQKLRMCFE